MHCSFFLSSVAGPLGTGIILRVIEGCNYELMNLTVADDAMDSIVLLQR